MGYAWLCPPTSEFIKYQPVPNVLQMPAPLPFYPTWVCPKIWWKDNLNEEWWLYVIQNHETLVRDVGVPGVPYLDSLRQHDMKRTPFSLPPSNLPGLDVRFHQPLAATQGAATPERRGMHPMKWRGLTANELLQNTCFILRIWELSLLDAFRLLTNLKHPEIVGWVCPGVERDS